MGKPKTIYLNIEEIIEKNCICRIYFNNGKIATGFFVLFL